MIQFNMKTPLQRITEIKETFQFPDKKMAELCELSLSGYRNKASVTSNHNKQFNEADAFRCTKNTIELCQKWLYKK